MLLYICLFTASVLQFVMSELCYINVLLCIIVCSFTFDTSRLLNCTTICLVVYNKLCHVVSCHVMLYVGLFLGAVSGLMSCIG